MKKGSGLWVQRFQRIRGLSGAVEIRRALQEEPKTAKQYTTQTHKIGDLASRWGLGFGSRET